MSGKGSCKICGSPCLCAGCTHQQVEGSTPEDKLIDEVIADAGPDMRSRRQGGRGAVALAAEPAPVPPPVDALRGVIEAARIYGRLAYADGRDDNDPEKSAAHWPAVKRAAQALWAAGVEEGRQQSAGQLKKERESFGRLALLYDGAVSDGDARYAAGVAEGRRQAAEAIRAADTSGWPGGRGGDVDGCQDLAAKIAEAGRRQATEERTEEVERLQVLLDHAEQYARDLQDGGNG